MAAPPLPSSVPPGPLPEPARPPRAPVNSPVNNPITGPEGGSTEGATIDEPTGADAVHLSFWQHPVVLNVLPFAVSLAMHLGIITIGIAMMGVVHAASKVATQEQLIIPEATMTDGPVGGILNPGLGGDQNRPAAQDKFPDAPADSQNVNTAPGRDLSSIMHGGGGADSGSEGLISGGVNTLMGKGRGSGAGIGDSLGGMTDGGALAPFGVPGGGSAAGPRSQFLGTGGNARAVAYVCDASGSMLTKFETLRVELKKAIEGLRVPQSFTVIFFQETSCIPVDPAGMLLATPENKRRAYDFLEKVTPHGGTDAVPSIEMAFKHGAQLIYLLTDGDFPDNAAVVNTIKRLNPTAKVRINTILFGTAQELGETKAFQQILEQIATENGGKFRAVDANNVPPAP